MRTNDLPGIGIRRMEKRARKETRPGLIRRSLRLVKTGRKSKQAFAKEAALIKAAYMSDTTRVSPPATPSGHGANQAANTVGSGTIGTVVGGFVYSVLPDTMDEHTRAAVAGAVGVIATVGLSFLHGWWKARKKAEGN